MADLERLADIVWDRIGPEGREMVREGWRLTHELNPELQPKVYACFLWVTWSRGRGYQIGGRPDFWDRV
jgi:hypothetical protein